MSSKIKVDNIADQGNNNLINKCGSTITLGASGDTIELASGASQTGFGRTGTVDWQTSIKTSSFTAASGEGYFINTTSGAITITLPASPSAGDIVAIKDYANTFDTNNLTIARNGSNISGEDVDATISVEGQALTLIYGDATKGWQSVYASTEADLPKPLYVAATGGTVTESGDFKIHKFTGPGTFTVTCVGNEGGSNTVDYLVVAGGGGGGYGRGGGGGAGGARASSGTASGCYTAGPIAACVAAVPVTAQGYPITVGGGGTGGGPSTPNNNGTIGSTSSGLSISSSGGGAGLGENQPGPGGTGGSGGGGARCSTTGQNGGAGNTPPVSPSQGNSGGNSFPNQGAGGGGGGAVAAGSNSVPAGSGGQGGQGGTGVTSCITASPVGYAGGGGGGNADCGPSSNLPNAPSVGGGGTGGTGIPPSPGPVSLATAGATNTGGGGGGGAHRYTPGDNYVGGNGGSGIVIIRYRFQS